jgi:uncharacterized protein (DUF1330 family)
MLWSRDYVESRGMSGVWNSSPWDETGRTQAGPGRRNQYLAGRETAEDTVSVYIVFTREKTLDPQELATYNKLVPATLEGHPIKILALYGAQETLEGPPNEGTVIVEFPTLEAAKAWYDGPEYRKVREHRFKGSDYRVTLVAGV